jgi:hypothetical protein
MDDGLPDSFRSDALRRRLPPWLRALLHLVWVLVCAAAFSQVHAADSAAPDLIGLTRADVLTALGKPQSTLRRGGTELLIYPKGVRVELRGEEVVAYQGSEEAVIIGRDGTRYTLGANGKVLRADPLPEVTHHEAEASPATGPAANISPTPAEAKKPATAAVTAAEDDDPVPSDDARMAKMRAEMEKAVEDLGKAPEAPPPPPVWIKLVGAIVGAVLHFVIVVVILRLALSIVGVPFFWPDLIKVCLLYLAVREGLHGLSDLGGGWQFIALFRFDDVVSFVVLAVLLFRFKIALSGLTALKVAAATKAATYMLMIGVGLALSFGLMSMH